MDQWLHISSPGSLEHMHVCVTLTLVAATMSDLGCLGSASCPEPSKPRRVVPLQAALERMRSTAITRGACLAYHFIIPF